MILVQNRRDNEDGTYSRSKTYQRHLRESARTMLKKNLILMKLMVLASNLKIGE